MVVYRGRIEVKGLKAGEIDRRCWSRVQDPPPLACSISLPPSLSLPHTLCLCLPLSLSPSHSLSPSLSLRSIRNDRRCCGDAPLVPGGGAHSRHVGLRRLPEVHQQVSAPALLCDVHSVPFCSVVSFDIIELLDYAKLLVFTLFN